MTMVPVETTVEVFRSFQRVRAEFPRPFDFRIILYLQQDLVDGHVQGSKAFGSLLSSAGRAYILSVDLWIVLLGRPVL